LMKTDPPCSQQRTCARSTSLCATPTGVSLGKTTRVFPSAIDVNRVLRALLAGAALAASGCSFSDDRLSPPREAVYFPTGLAVSHGRTALYVANSDRDIQYNGGTVEVLDLGSIRARLDAVLAGVRCSQGAADACAQPQEAPPSVQAVCNGVPVSDAAAAGI